MFSFWLRLTKLRRIFVILYVDIECSTEQELMILMRGYGDRETEYQLNVRPRVNRATRSVEEKTRGLQDYDEA
ncbi:hypothetical protein J6590_053027 [Homalodisca vitripennis]|nr:hypothetical protein J6590_053027 [Homalodisca vitripennis]